MNSTVLQQLIKGELLAQRASGYALWRTLPSSATKRALAFLEQPPPINTSVLELHDTAIEAIHSRVMAGDQKQQAPFSKVLLEWNEQRHQPWRYGVDRGEWYFTGHKEQKDLAEILLKLRSNPAAVAPTARTLVSYYAGVSDQELALALNWKPVRATVFVSALLDKLASMQVKVERQMGFREKRFLVQTGNSALAADLEFRGGTLNYKIFRFFSNPQMSACYESFFGIGSGEWDLLSNGSEETAAVVFAGILNRLLTWNGEIRANLNKSD